MLRCSKMHELKLTPHKLAWPWVAFAPDRTAFAVPVGRTTLEVRSASSLAQAQRVELPAALHVPIDGPSPTATASRQPGLHSIALHPDGRTLVGFGWHEGIPVACVERVGGAPELVDLGPALGDMGPLAATFTRDGASIWVSAESATGAAIARLAFRDFALESKVAFPAPPPPASHELLLHPTQDAVLLVMACGEDGTFARVAREVGGKLELVSTEADDAIEPCGLAGTTEDGHGIAFVAFDHVELRGWPDLDRIARYDLEDEVRANFNGVRIGGRFLVSATEEDGDEERALVLDGAMKLHEDAPAPPGMWAGTLAGDRLLTISRGSDGERTAFVYAIEV